MKNKLLAGSLAVLTLLSLLLISAAALEPSRITVEQRPSVTIVVDGTARTFYDAAGKEVHPLYYNGTHYLPVRAIGELMGKTVSWNSQTRTITLASEAPLVTDADSFGPAGTAAAPSSGTNPGTLITAGAAKSAALTHAKLTAAQVTFVECKLDWEDGRQIYEIEFYTADGSEYDYEIDACTAAVLKVDYDAEGYVPADSNLITLEKARSIALQRIPGATLSHVHECEFDRDDCRYDCEIWYNGCEYECKVDARTGTVVEWECDRHGAVCPSIHAGTAPAGHHRGWHH